MSTVVQVRRVIAHIGLAIFEGFLTITEPFHESFLKGTLSLGDGLSDASVKILVDGAPVCVNLRQLTICIRFDAAARQFVGFARSPEDPSPDCKNVADFET